jgi:hypothetical protein
MIHKVIESMMLVALAIAPMQLNMPVPAAVEATPHEQQEEQITPPQLETPRAPTLDEALLALEVAYACSQDENYLDAVVIYRKALPILQSKMKSNSKLVSSVYSELASCYVHLNVLEMADKAANESLRIAINCPDMKSEELAVTASNAAVIKSLRHDFVSSQRLFEQGLHYVAPRRSPGQRLIYAILEINCADMYSEKGDNVAARQLYVRALRALREETAANDPILHDLEKRIESLSKGGPQHASH